MGPGLTDCYLTDTWPTSSVGCRLEGSRLEGEPLRFVSYGVECALHIDDIKPASELEANLLRGADMAKSQSAVQANRRCVG